VVLPTVSVRSLSLGSTMLLLQRGECPPRTALGLCRIAGAHLAGRRYLRREPGRMTSLLAPATVRRGARPPRMPTHAGEQHRVVPSAVTGWTVDGVRRLRRRVSGRGGNDHSGLRGSAGKRRLHQIGVLSVGGMPTNQSRESVTLRTTQRRFRVPRIPRAAAQRACVAAPPVEPSCLIREAGTRVHRRRGRGALRVRAARRLNITQPALSRQIQQQLEREVGGG
jgi:hypothetical protein